MCEAPPSQSVSVHVVAMRTNVIYAGFLRWPSAAGALPAALLRYERGRGGRRGWRGWPATVAAGAAPDQQWLPRAGESASPGHRKRGSSGGALTVRGSRRPLTHKTLHLPPGCGGAPRCPPACGGSHSQKRVAVPDAARLLQPMQGAPVGAHEQCPPPWPAHVAVESLHRQRWPSYFQAAVCSPMTWNKLAEDCRHWSQHSVGSAVAKVVATAAFHAQELPWPWHAGASGSGGGGGASLRMQWEA